MCPLLIWEIVRSTAWRTAWSTAWSTSRWTIAFTPFHTLSHHQSRSPPSAPTHLFMSIKALAWLRVDAITLGEDLNHSQLWPATSSVVYSVRQQTEVFVPNNPDMPLLSASDCCPQIQDQPIHKWTHLYGKKSLPNVLDVSCGQLKQLLHARDGHGNCSLPLVTGEAAITAATHHVAHRVVLQQIERLQSRSESWSTKQAEHGRTPCTSPAAEYWKSVPRTVSHSAPCFLPQHPHLVMRRSKYPTEREPKGHGLTRSANVLQSHSQIAWFPC